MTRAEAIPNVGQNPLLTLADRKIIPGKWGLDMPAGHLTGHWPFATDGDSSAVARHPYSAGRSRHGRPVRVRNKIPLTTIR